MMYEKVDLRHAGWRNRVPPRIHQCQQEEKMKRKFASRFFSPFLLFSFSFLSPLFPFFIFPVVSPFGP
jgi:hypothetical protein